jgi:hypothetical protein
MGKGRARAPQYLRAQGTPIIILGSNHGKHLSSRTRIRLNIEPRDGVSTVARRDI